ncbi:MAG: hypothetical protein AB7I25_03165 [Vicinamibacterales bacterium]
MASHAGLLVLFAGFVSVVFGALTADGAAAQVRTGARMFAGFLLAGLALGWVLRFLPL